MVLSKVEVDPRRAFIQFPIAGWNESLIDFVGSADGRPPPVSLEPHTVAIGMYFAAAFPAPATGAVSRVFRALGLGAEERQMLKAAIPAFPTGKKHLL